MTIITPQALPLRRELYVYFINKEKTNTNSIVYLSELCYNYIKYAFMQKSK